MKLEPREKLYLYCFLSKINLILFYNLHVGKPLRVTCVFQFVRVYIRINHLNATIMLWSSTIQHQDL